VLVEFDAAVFLECKPYTIMHKREILTDDLSSSEEHDWSKVRRKRSVGADHKWMIFVSCMTDRFRTCDWALW
jgi:hypothetical protein